MRILHILPDLGPAGAERMMKRLVQAQLDDPAYQHRVLSLRDVNMVGLELRALGVEVEALGLTSAARLPATLWRLVLSIRAAKPDIVQTWMYHADLLGGLAARLAGVRRILWGVRVADISSDMGVAPATFGIRRICARLSRYIPSYIVYVCHSARLPHERLGYDATKGLVIPNGYVVPAELKPTLEQPLRQELAIAHDVILIGSAGRNIAQKDHPTFIAASAQVAAQIPEAQFVIIGRGLDWKNAELAQLIRETGYAERFHLLGERRDILDCMAALDIFCMHSIQEGFPNVVAEAMSVGTPCVVTDVGDAALLVGETGTVVPPRDPDLLAAALIAIITLVPGRREALGKQARRRIEEHFSIAAVASKFAGLYRNLMCS